MDVTREDELFWGKVSENAETECWSWTGCINNKGYGRFKRKGKMLLAHRISYEKTFGPIPNSQQVCHTCDNPKCVNPVHLFLGTQLDNVRDMHRKRRGCYGERHPGAKITAEEVLQIREMYVPGVVGCYAIGKRFGVGAMAVWDIITRHTWAGI